MPQEQSQIRERQKTNLREPRRYKVMIHNDDFTTMDFVVKVLREVFFLSDENAQALMLSFLDCRNGWQKRQKRLMRCWNTILSDCHYR